MKKKAIIVSGYFNPVHKGHIEYFMNAKKIANYLIVIVNNDYQRKIKQSKEFMLEDERIFIVKNLQMVDKCYMSIDKDRTVINTIELIYNELNHKYDLYFGNGGDQNNDIIPERDICDKLSIKLIDNLGEKIQSSSWILNNE
jgi:cytidyltransferase-like protein|tara:strand:- start:17228 stop:17653 length:426 start_codon:yes stop_codon:yes gene_type:complete